MAYKEYEYDGQNRLMSTTFHVGDETQTYRPIYDTRKSDGAVYADNAVVGVTLEGVFTSKAEQDDWGRVTEKKLTMTGAATPLLSEGYGYLDVSAGFETRLTTMVQLLTRRVNGVTKDTLRYTYDNNGNITAIRNGAGTEYYAKYTYDGLNQLTREDNAVLGKSWVFAYDTAGNILSKKEYAYTTGTLGAVLDTKTYTYATTGWKDRLTSFSGEAIAYDALGNPTTYRGHALTWGRISELNQYDSHTFSYDGKGNRISKNSIAYINDENRILQEIRPTGTITYYYGVSGICGFQYNNVRYYYERDLQGDITAIYDESGNLKAEYQYDAWGNHEIKVDIDGIGTLNPFRYRGYYYDTETGLYYVNTRYYDSQTGRFINADDIAYLDANGTILGYNLFTYCENNPVNMVDVNGHFGTPIQWVLAIIGGIAGWYFGDYVAKALGYQSGWKYWAIRAGVTIGGAVIGWFAGSVVTRVVVGYLSKNPSLIFKLVNSVGLPTFKVIMNFLGIDPFQIISNPSLYYAVGRLLNSQNFIVPLDWARSFCEKAIEFGAQLLFHEPHGDYGYHIHVTGSSGSKLSDLHLQVGEEIWKILKNLFGG